MKTNTSKAPWAQSIHDDSGDIVVRDLDGNIIANCTTDSGFLSGRAQMANAELTAAAPDMLAALEGLMKIFNGAEGKRRNVTTLISIAEAAIAKAKGGK